MRSRQFPLILAVITSLLSLNACGESGRLPEHPLVAGGPGLSFFAMQTTDVAASVTGNQLVPIDETTSAILTFGQEPFEFRGALPLPFQSERQAVMAAPSGEYYVVTAGADYAILRADGSIDRNPFALEGKISTAAYSGKCNIVVLVDEFGSTLLLKTDSGGKVLAGWVGGPVLGHDKKTNWYALTDNGMLVDLLNGNTLAIADVERSMNEKKWVYEEFTVVSPEPQLTTFRSFAPLPMEWIASVPGKNHLILAHGNDGLRLIDIQRKTVLSTTIMPPGQTVARFYDAVPHVAVQRDDQPSWVELHYVAPDESLQKRVVEIRQDVPGTIWQSHIDPANETISVAQSTTARTPRDFARYGVYRFRLSDSLLLGQANFDDDVRLALTHDFVFVQKDSPLGYLARRGYGRTDSESLLTGFNFERLQRQQN